MRIVRTVVLAASAPLLLLAFAEIAAAADLITGTATYEVSLDASKGAIAASVSGRMIQSIRRNCDAYSSETELSADFSGANGATLPLRVKSTTVESRQTLTFDLAGSLGSVVTESARGTATRNADGVSVSLTVPETRQIELKGDILFPVAFAQELLNAADSGKRFATFRLFDGGGHGKTAWSVSAVIGSPDKAQESSEETEFAAALGFAALKRWPMQLSYFAPTAASGEAQPVFASVGVVYENGFTSSAIYDYGQFAFRLTLVEFTPAPPTPCS